MSALQVGQLVMVVRTNTGLDGATGTVEGGLIDRWCTDLRSGHVSTCLGYAVRLSRLTPWGEVLCFSPDYLVPLSPPDADEPRNVPEQLPAHALV